MKKKLSILLIMCLIGIFILPCGCTSTDETTQSSSTGASSNTYENPTYRLRLQYPKEYYVQYGNPSENPFSPFTLFDLHIPSENSSFEPRFLIVTRKINPGRTVYEETQFEWEGLNEAYRIDLENDQIIYIGQYPAVSKDYTLEYNSTVKFNAYSLWVVRDDRLYYITLYAFKEDFKQSKIIVDRIISSFEFY